MTNESLETVAYAAKRLGISEARVYELVRQGILCGAVGLGRRIKIDPKALEQFISKGGKALPGGWKAESSQ